MCCCCSSSSSPPHESWQHKSPAWRLRWVGGCHHYIKYIHIYTHIHARDSFIYLKTRTSTYLPPPPKKTSKRIMKTRKTKLNTHTHICTHTDTHTHPHHTHTQTHIQTPPKHPIKTTADGRDPPQRAVPHRGRLAAAAGGEAPVGQAAGHHRYVYCLFICIYFDFIRCFFVWFTLIYMYLYLFS